MKKIDDNIYHIIEEIESNKARIGISVKFSNFAHGKHPVCLDKSA